MTATEDLNWMGGRGEAGQQVPGSATQTALLVLRFSQPGTVQGWEPAAGGGVQGGFSFIHCISLGGPCVSSTPKWGWVKNEPISQDERCMRCGWPASKVMTVRNFIKGHCLEWHLNSKSDTIIIMLRASHRILSLRTRCPFHCESAGALIGCIVCIYAGLKLAGLTGSL